MEWVVFILFTVLFALALLHSTILSGADDHVEQHYWEIFYSATTSSGQRLHASVS